MTVGTVAELAITQTHRAPAEVVSLNSSAIAAEVQAVVAAVHADAGTRVEAGAPLLELDPTDLALAVRQMEASLAALDARITQADKRLERARNLGAGDYISADDLLARETDLAVLRAERSLWEVRLEIARRDVAKCRIAAPFAGVVEARHAQLGALVRPGEPLLTLVQTDRLELVADVPGHLAQSLGEDSGARFAVDERTWPLVPLRTSPVIRPATRIRQAYFGFAGDDKPLIGTAGELVWDDRVPSLPAHLVVRRGDALGVFVVEAGRARFQVLSGAEEGRPVQAELAVDTVIVIGGRERLNDGDPVRIGVR